MKNKNKRGGWSLGLRWPPFDGEKQQQTTSWQKRWIRGWGDGELGNKVGVGHYLIVWAVEVSDKKITKLKHVLALDGHHTIFTCNNKPKTHERDKGDEGEEVWLGEERGGSAIPSFLQVAASSNYHGVQWILGFAQCVSSQYGVTLTVR